MLFFMTGCNILRSGGIIRKWTNFIYVVFYMIGGFFSLCLKSQKTNRPPKLLCFFLPISIPFKFSLIHVHMYIKINKR